MAANSSDLDAQLATSKPFFFKPGPRAAIHNIARCLIPADLEHTELIKLIEQDRSQLELRTPSGETPLISAAKAGAKNMTLILVSRGARVAVADETGYSPKLFKQTYVCDHDHDPDACIPLERNMDAPLRAFLTAIESMEIYYLQETGLFALNDIKSDLFSIINNSNFQDPKPLATLCGYVFNRVAESERPAVLEFFETHVKMDISQEPWLSDAFTRNAVDAEAPGISFG